MPKKIGNQLPTSLKISTSRDYWTKPTTKCNTCMHGSMNDGVNNGLHGSMSNGTYQSIASLCPFHVWKEMTVDSCGCLKKLPLYSNSVKECTIVITSFGELMVQWDLAVNSRGKSLNGKTKPLELLFIHVSNLWLDWRLHFASGSYFSWIFLVNFICSFIHFF